MPTRIPSVRDAREQTVFLPDGIPPFCLRERRILLPIPLLRELSAWKEASKI
jgi:hypothetical protein